MMNHDQNRAVDYATRGHGGAPVLSVSRKAMGISAQMAQNYVSRVLPCDITYRVDRVAVY